MLYERRCVCDYQIYHFVIIRDKVDRSPTRPTNGWRRTPSLRFLTAVHSNRTFTTAKMLKKKLLIDTGATFLGNTVVASIKIDWTIALAFFSVRPDMLSRTVRLFYLLYILYCAVVHGVVQSFIMGYGAKKVR